MRRLNASDSVSMETESTRPTLVKFACAAWLVLMFLSATGCATVAHGLKQDLAIRSDPPGAEIWINGKASGETPAIVPVRRRRGVVLRLEKANFEPLEMRISRKPSAWLWVDAAICFNPFAVQGLDSASQWPAVIGVCLAQLVGLDVLLGGAYKFEGVPTINLTPRPSAPAAAVWPQQTETEGVIIPTSTDIGATSPLTQLPSRASSAADDASACDNDRLSLGH
jgi:hypothetical protein